VTLWQFSNLSRHNSLSLRPSFSHDELQHLLLSVPNGGKAREWSTYYTSESHLPGQGLRQGEWTRDKWEEFGILDTEITAYEAYLTYASGQRLAVLDLDKPHAQQVLFEAALVEDPAETQNQAKGPEPFAPGYHGFSASGNVTAPYVFANFGAKEDFQTLVQANVSLEGKIAIVKAAQLSQYVEQHNFTMFRGEQVFNAQDMGMVGVVVYADPQNDADMVEDNGYLPFPHGPGRPETMIERGTLGTAGKVTLFSISKENDY
jgi:N-acetylated-alpha-linked acidic dipeptidase